MPSHSCALCGNPARHAVVTGAEFDDDGELLRPKHAWSCKPCSELPLATILARVEALKAGPRTPRSPPKKP